MGARDWILAFCTEDPRQVLRSRPVLDHGAARAAAERLHPGRTITAGPDGTLGEEAAPEADVLYVGAFPGLTLVCTGQAALDHPVSLPEHVLRAIPATTVYLHAMHSVVDWFAYAVWQDHALQRSLSLSPDRGILENLGAPLPWEEPYWAGGRPVDTDPGREPYPLPFHPLELAEDALRALFGFTFEGRPDPEDVDPDEILLAGFAISE
jgi:hypothetical protein